MKGIRFFYSSLFTFFLMTAVGFSQGMANGDFLTHAIDSSVNPAADFFKFATGTWMKNNPIPPTERAWGIGNLVQEETYARLKSILQDAQASNASKGSNEQKVGDFYFTGMDSTTIDSQGIAPLRPELDRIDSIKNKKDLYDVVALLQREGVNVMYGLFIDQDQMKSDAYAMYLWQGGLGLPNREYYFRNDERTKRIRDEYKKHVAKMLELVGEDSITSTANANDIYQIEVFLADSSRKLEDLRDPYANYNKMSMTNLNHENSDIDWTEIFADEDVKGQDSVIVGQPEFFHELDVAVNKFSIAEWKEYLRWHLVNTFADRLSSPIEVENFHFKGTIMAGVKEQRPRWKRVQDATESAMGELLGQVYVKKYYSAETKKRYESLVNNMISAFAERIKNLDWMSDSTKQKALYKLSKLTKKVGYPDKWKDFSKLSVDKGSYVRNTINANIFWFDRDANKLGKPVDRSEWDMTPQTYNAYYNPSNNEIVLPAAIFIIPGVPDSLIDDAVVYSYAGASTIGHEMTHGFDDEGRQYDAQGNLRDWWTKGDAEKFQAKTKLMVDQFDDYIVLDSMHINGKATLGENIADLGGLVIGYDAFRQTEEYKEGKPVNGLTPSQRFWMGYAYSWLGHARPEALAQQVLTDVHSPNFLRVNGPLSDIPEFYKAFGVKDGQPMWRAPDRRVKIW
ncbi:MAG TPA: M13 family metallopeptidase [Candidatus Acidoferrales bacterium]|nr:M13 family metallopeptidase [Candidatus Acidoferrales bacterium]